MQFTFPFLLYSPSFFSAARPLCLLSAVIHQFWVLHHSPISTLFSHAALFEHGLCVHQYISYPSLHRWRDHSACNCAPQTSERCIFLPQGFSLPQNEQPSRGKRINNGLQLRIAPNTLNQLCQSHISSSSFSKYKPTPLVLVRLTIKLFYCQNESTCLLVKSPISSILLS